mmetsp:Transcript_26316/g.40377  ORF Transcript_26316/g.40377 Transcript_26316/m.40377 type:complete len:380 (+) Transcript_26316:30-1169(+)
MGVMKKSNGLSLLVVCVMVCLCSGAWWNNNSTTEEQDDVLTATLDSTSIPFPGRGWLDTFATVPSNRMEWKGTTFGSAYDVLFDGHPEDHVVRNFNAWVNSWIFSPATVAQLLHKTQSIEWTHYLLCYLRNLLGGILVYYGTSLIFHYHIYIHPRSQQIFHDRERPSPAIIWDQIKLAQMSLFIYTALPVVDEYIIEQQWTYVYYTVAQIGGWPFHLLSMLVYFTMVEIGIYWMHRTLHTNKFLYKHIHMLHHKYNKPETLTPWASIAFHPLDGILQASPYVLCLFFIPCHYMTHFVLLFFTAIWATYIHDSMDFNVDPIMGSKYHTMHHTHYIYNYGQVFTFCDRFWGTLRVPQGKTGVKASVGGGDSPQTSHSKKES